MQGAGGTSGGTKSFFLGLLMFCVGAYLFLSSVTVSSNFNLGFVLFRFSGLNLTTGAILVPFIFGVGFIFYNSKWIIGWLLTCLSLSAFFFGIIMSLNFSLQRMSMYELLTILVLLVGGVGLILRSLKDSSKQT